VLVGIGWYQSVLVGTRGDRSVSVCAGGAGGDWLVLVGIGQDWSVELGSVGVVGAGLENRIVLCLVFLEVWRWVWWCLGVWLRFLLFFVWFVVVDLWNLLFLGVFLCFWGSVFLSFFAPICFNIINGKF
jgi:hypothetical protein